MEEEGGEKGAEHTVGDCKKAKERSGWIWWW